MIKYFLIGFVVLAALTANAHPLVDLQAVNREGKHDCLCKNLRRYWIFDKWQRHVG